MARPLTIALATAIALASFSSIASAKSVPLPRLAGTPYKWVQLGTTKKPCIALASAKTNDVLRLKYSRNAPLRMFVYGSKSHCQKEVGITIHAFKRVSVNGKGVLRASNDRNRYSILPNRMSFDNFSTKIIR